MPRVSIVTISFNQAKYLERAILSVLHQDHPDVEYIVVDPGSSDGSRDIIERYRSRISKIIYKPDNGPAQGLNHGFAAATGDIFGYMNADDAYLPGAIKKAVAAFQSRPNADVIYGHSYIINGNGHVVRRSRSVPFDLQRFAYGGVVVMQQSTFFLRQAFEKVGGFNEDNHTSWDGEILVDFARAGIKLEMVNEYWSLFAVYPGSITASARYDRQWQEDRARIFRAITGKEYSRAGKARFLLARIEKLLRNPLVPAHRIVDKSFGLRSPSVFGPSL